METNTQNVARGTSLPVVVFVVFLILKLVGVITWSWWWVTAPLWIAAGLAVGLWIVMLIIFAIAWLVTSKR